MHWVADRESACVQTEPRSAPLGFSWSITAPFRPVWLAQCQEDLTVCNQGVEVFPPAIDCHLAYSVQDASLFRATLRCKGS